MGTIFLLTFGAIVFGVCEYRINAGADEEIVNRNGMGALFIGIAIQIAIDWLVSKEFRVFYIVAPIESENAKPIAFACIAFLVGLGSYTIIF